MNLTKKEQDIVDYIESDEAKSVKDEFSDIKDKDMDKLLLELKEELLNFDGRKKEDSLRKLFHLLKP